MQAQREGGRSRDGTAVAEPSLPRLRNDRADHTCRSGFASQARSPDSPGTARRGTGPPTGHSHDGRILPRTLEMNYREGRPSARRKSPYSFGRHHHSAADAWTAFGPARLETREPRAMFAALTNLHLPVNPSLLPHVTSGRESPPYDGILMLIGHRTAAGRYSTARNRAGKSTRDSAVLAPNTGHAAADGGTEPWFLALGTR
jgi:hypothetical protein